MSEKTGTIEISDEFVDAIKQATREAVGDRLDEAEKAVESLSERLDALEESLKQTQTQTDEGDEGEETSGENEEEAGSEEEVSEKIAELVEKQFAEKLSDFQEGLEEILPAPVRKSIVGQDDGGDEGDEGSSAKKSRRHRDAFGRRIRSA